MANFEKNKKVARPDTFDKFRVRCDAFRWPFAILKKDGRQECFQSGWPSGPTYTFRVVCMNAPTTARISIGTIENEDLLRLKQAAQYEAMRTVDHLGRPSKFSAWLFEIVTDEYNRRVACDDGQPSPMKPIIVPPFADAELVPALIRIRSIARNPKLPASVSVLVDDLELHLLAQIQVALQ